MKTLTQFLNLKMLPLAFLLLSQHSWAYLHGEPSPLKRAFSASKSMGCMKQKDFLTCWGIGPHEMFKQLDSMSSEQLLELLKQNEFIFKEFTSSAKTSFMYELFVYLTESLS